MRKDCNQCVVKKILPLAFFIGIRIILWFYTRLRKEKKIYIADPRKGLVKYSLDEFKSHWISTKSNGEEKDIAMFLEPTPAFYSHKEDSEGEKKKNPRSFRFLFGYVKKYRRYFGQVVLGMIVGSLLQLVLPFLTQPIVDVGIKNKS